MERLCLPRLCLPTLTMPSPHRFLYVLMRWTASWTRILMPPCPDAAIRGRRKWRAALAGGIGGRASPRPRVAAEPLATWPRPWPRPLALDVEGVPRCKNEANWRRWRTLASESRSIRTFEMHRRTYCDCRRDDTLCASFFWPKCLWLIAVRAVAAVNLCLSAGRVIKF